MAGLLSSIRRTLGDMSLKKKLGISYILIIFIPLMISNYFLLNELNLRIDDYKESRERNSIEQISYNIDERLRLIDQISDNIYFNPRFNKWLYSSYGTQVEIYDAYTGINEFLYTNLYMNSDLLDIRIYSANKTLPPDGSKIFRIDGEIASLDWYKGAIMNRRKGYYSNLPKADAAKMGGRQVFYSTRSLNYLDYHFSPSILFLVIDESRFHALIEKESIGKTIYIVNEHGSIISSNDRASLSKNIGEVLDFQLPDSGGRLYTKLNNVDNLVLHTTNNHQWTIVSVTPVKNLFKLPRDMSLFYFSIYLLCLGVSIFMISMFSRILTKRLSLFKTFVQNIDTENLQPIRAISGNDEIGMIFKVFNNLLIRIRDYLSQVKESEAKTRTAEIKALQAQINPHFLYNTIDTIYALIEKNDNEKAGRLLMDLSQLYKSVLSKGDGLIRIREEIQILKRYLSIELEKLDTEVQVTYLIKNEVLDDSILKFLLQPFIENILHHAIFFNTRKINILIKIFKLDHYLNIHIIDDGLGMDKNKLAGVQGQNSSSGYAIFNIRERLRLYYMDDFFMDIYSRIGIGTQITLKIPVIKNPGV